MAKKELDKLSRDMIECEKAGFGVHYGRWKATQKPVKKIPVLIPEGWKPCEFCGKPFKRNHAQRFCDLYCRNMAYKEKETRIKAEYMRGYRERQKAEAAG